MSKKLYHLFLLQETEDTFARVLGAAGAMAVPLLLGLYLDNMTLAKMGAMGAFAFLSVENRPIPYLLKKFAVISLSFLAAIALGMWGASHNYWVPLIIGVVSLASMMVSRVLQVPKPGSFFIIMVCSMACNIPAKGVNMVIRLGYVGIGLIGSTLIAVLVVLYMQRVKQLPIPAAALSWRPAVQRALDEDSVFVLSTLLHAMLIASVTYIAVGLNLFNPFWATISCAAVIQPHTFAGIYQRHLQRIIGAFVGVGLASVFLSFQPSDAVMVGLIIFLNLNVEFFMVRNYALANFFTNPQALLMTALGALSEHESFSLVWGRYSAILLGSIVGMAGAYVTYKAIEFYKPQELLDLPDSEK